VFESQRALAGLRGLVESPPRRRSQLELFTSARLRKLVSHAYNRVPYYRQLFDHAGLKPEQVQSLDDLARIPQSTRAGMQAQADADVVSRGHSPRRLVLHRSSGSTGEPFNVRRTVFEDRLLQAYRLAILFRLGMRIGDRRAAVVSAHPIPTALYTRLGMLRYEEIHCLLPPEQILSQLRKARADILRGFPGTLSWLVGQMTEADRRYIRPRFITTDSETLTADMRALIAAGFGARVFDFYDSHEFNMIAWECPSSGLYHLSDRTVIAEVVINGRAAQPGETGELVATALHSWAMPFIRFRLGDVVTRGPNGCPCGAPNATLARVQGRVVDRFELPDGTSLHPYTLTGQLLKEGPWIRRFQIVQERRDQIVVKLVPLAGEAPTAEASSRLSESLAAAVGSGVSVNVELVDQIPAQSNGKFRPYFSRVAL